MMKKIIFVMLILFILGGCSLDDSINDANPNDNEGTIVITPPVKTPVAPDNETEVDSVVTTTYGDFKISSIVKDSYSKNGDIITFTKPGEYSVSGKLSGSLVFSATIGESVTLYLNNAEITSKDYHGIYWMSEEFKIEIKTVENTNNSITILGDQTKLFSAIESENNIELGGSGNLVIVGNQRHAVKGSNIEIKGNGTLEIEAVKDGLHGKQVLISGGNTTISKCTDAIQADVNNANMKGTITVEEGILTINNCKRAFRAAVSLTVQQLPGLTLTINVNSTNITVEAPTVNYVSGTFKVNGANYKN